MNVRCFPPQLLVWLGSLSLFQGVLMPQVWCGSWMCKMRNDCTLSLWHFVDLALNSICRWWRYFRNGPPPRSSHFWHGCGEKKKWVLPLFSLEGGIFSEDFWCGLMEMPVHCGVLCTYHLWAELNQSVFQQRLESLVNCKVNSKLFWEMGRPKDALQRFAGKREGT